MIQLEDLRPSKGATKKSKKVGRGRASGHGKTSCRGNNGEGQRSGRSAKRGFEGGQMPQYRQLPKLKGFKNNLRIPSAEINVGKLDNLGVEVVDLTYLIETSKAHPSSELLRVLGSGEVTKAIKVHASYFSPSAKEKIEKAGGEAVIV